MKKQTNEENKEVVNKWCVLWIKTVNQGNLIILESNLFLRLVIEIATFNQKKVKPQMISSDVTLIFFSMGKS